MGRPPHQNPRPPGPRPEGSGTGRPRRVLAAFDKFKDAITAAEACRIAARAARGTLGAATGVDEAPLTDGGEGFCSALTEAAGGRLRRYRTVCACGEPVSAPVGWVPPEKVPPGARGRFPELSGPVAVVELASAAGLAAIPPGERHPGGLCTRGVGELLRHAAHEGAAAILLGIGGSATNDLGLGALQALGVACLDQNGEPVGRATPGNWARIAGFDPSGRISLPPVRIACDVDNPLLGDRGATAAFGPQKGLAEREITPLDQRAADLSARLCRALGASPDLPDMPGAGAAGGIGFALAAAFGARLVPGFALVAEWLGLEERIRAADLVLSGEGAIDRGSLSGKGPVALARMAEEAGKPSALFGGTITETAREALARDCPRCTPRAITPGECDLATALRETGRNLHAAVSDFLTPDRAP